MKDQLNEEIKDYLEPNITQETSKNILGFDVINIKKENDEINLESNTATASDRVEEHESENQSRKIKCHKKFSCEICHKSFALTNALKLHMNIHTREKVFKCSECNKEFLWKNAFKYHWLRHHKNEKSKHKKLSCEICHKSYAVTNALKLHMNIHTREKVFKCSECNKEFLYKNAFKYHWLRHHKNEKSKQKKLSCEICHKIFVGTYELKLHMNIHTREKVFKCSECNKEFLWKNAFKCHWLRHHKNEKNEKSKPISCEICHTSFGATGALKLHMNIHTREKLFKCTECDKEFLRKYGFKRHWLRVHKKEKLKVAIEKPHQCEYCDKKFRERSFLIKHIRVHTGEKPFECSKCGKTYTRKDAMKVHMQTHIRQNKKPFSCEICLKSFARAGVLKLHMNIHTREKLFKCSECDREFLEKHNFTRHLLTHKKQSLKPFSCEICRKGFGDKYNFKLHMNIHTREKLFKCSECDREFLHKSNFRRHLQLTHKDEILKEKPHSNSGEIASSNESIGDMKSKFKTIKAEKIDENEIVITEYTDPEEKIKPDTDRKASSHLSYNSYFGESICKEEVILPDEVEFEWKSITETIQ